MWPNVETDVLGELATVDIDVSVYSEAAIFKTAYWLTDRFYLFLERIPSGAVRVELRNKPGSTASLQGACAEFCNALIDFNVREIVNRETLGIREALLRHAFMEGVPKPGLEGAVSDERHLTHRPAD